MRRCSTRRDTPLPLSLSVGNAADAGGDDAAALVGFVFSMADIDLLSETTKPPDLEPLVEIPSAVDALGSPSEYFEADIRDLPLPVVFAGMTCAMCDESWLCGKGDLGARRLLGATDAGVLLVTIFQ